MISRSIFAFLNMDSSGGKEPKGSNLDEEKRSSSVPTKVGSLGLIILIGNELREKLRRWLSPPDPSTNHNSARKVHHEGTSTWFFQGGMFREWMSSPSLLWIHGKRTSHRLSLYPSRGTHIFVAGSGKSVLWFVISRPCFQHRLNLSQFWDNRRDHGPTRGRIGGSGLFLL
jgi:hypothetical protein